MVAFVQTHIMYSRGSCFQSTGTDSNVAGKMKFRRMTHGGITELARDQRAGQGLRGLRRVLSKRHSQGMEQEGSEEHEDDL